MDQLGVIKPIRLRSQPIEELRRKDVASLPSKGLQHQYELIEREGGTLVVDHTTDLMWQQSGSDEQITFAEAEKYVQRLNDKKYAGYNDWRLWKKRCRSWSQK